MLSPTQKGALSSLYSDGDNIPANIADMAGFHRVSISRALSELEDRGLVKDKGRSVYTLTAEGQKLAKELQTVEN